MTYFDNARQAAQALKGKERVRILAVETSCDETAAAVIENGRTILSSCIYSQIDLHALYGGVVPEIASRAHIDKVDVLVDRALCEARLSFSDIDAFAVTYGPGLVGALLVGVSAMKGLSYALQKPLVPVHHIEGHICANYLTSPELEPPFTCLVVSGGHSHILNVEDYGRYSLVGCTQDDAAGEAFDKAARVLDLPYPGGPRLDKLANEGDPNVLMLPHPRTGGAYDFSFSGLKTAFINAIHKLNQKGETFSKADMAASFRETVVSILVEKTMLAAQDFGVKTLAMAGGVSANSLLRARMTQECKRHGIALYMPALALCGDNAAMIGSAAYYRLMNGEIADLSLNAKPSLSLID